LINKVVPSNELDDAVDTLAKNLAKAPKNQMAMQKLVLNNAVEVMFSNLKSYSNISFLKQMGLVRE